MKVTTNNTTSSGKNYGNTNEVRLNCTNCSGAGENIKHSPAHKLPINLAYANYNNNQSRQGPISTKAPISDLNAHYKKDFPGDEFDEPFFEQLKAKGEKVDAQVQASPNLERLVNANQNQNGSDSSSLSIKDMLPISQFYEGQQGSSKKSFP